MKFIEQYIVLTGAFVLIDAIWLSVVANKYYKKQLGSLLAPKPNFVPAVIFYALYIWAVIVFALDPAVQGSHNLLWLAGRAALLGAAMYATYNLTNASTLKNWPQKLALVDITWGIVITTAVSAVGYWIFS